MSFAFPDGASRRAPWRLSGVGARLALAYAALFALSAVLLIGLAYGALGLVLARQDAAFLRAERGRIEAIYARDGLAGVRRYAADLQREDRGEEILIRIAGPDNGPRLVVLPDEWLPADVAVLDAREGIAEIANAREGRTLDVRTRRLAGGDIVQVGMTSDERDDTLDALPRVFGFVAVPLVLLALVGGWAMATRALQPVRQLVGTLEAVATTGDVRARAPVPASGGEFADLFRLFNLMLERIEALVGRLGETLEDVAHDLRTPLTAVRGTAELALSRDREPDAYRAALARIVEATEAAQATLDTVMDTAEAQAGALTLDLAPLRLDALAADVADLYRLAADDKGVTVNVEAPREVTVRADRRRLRRALANLVDNAVKYTPEGGRVSVRVSETAAGALVEVRDTGVGIAPDDLPRIWDRLYRAEETRHERGLGLGLGLARAIAEAHGGRLEARSTVGEGSVFTLTLPLRANLSDL